MADGAVHPDSLLGRLERAAMAAGALLLLVIVAMSIWSAVRTGDDLQQAARSFAARSATRDVMQTVTEAETGQRGFLLTGNPSYLEPYRHALASLPDQQRVLAAYAAADPDLAAWRRAIAEKMAELAATIQLAEQGNHEGALAVVRSDAGHIAMQQVRDIADRMTERQRVRLISALNHSGAGVRTVILVDLAAVAVLILLVTVVVVGVERYAERMRTTQAALTSAHDELAARRPILEAAVAARTFELSRANDELQRFAYIVSHDLRAPLLNIIGFTSELESATATLNDHVGATLRESGAVVPEAVRQASEEDLPEAIRFIRTSTAKMDRLINAILRLSREGRRVLTPEALDMTALVGDLAGSLQQQIEASSAELRIAPLPPLTCDRTAMEQIFSNLLENALKYTASGRTPVIEVSGATSLDPDGRRMATYRVSDNGRGIAERDMERIFELFRRSGVQDRPGEGIGLAHVRGLVRRLGGDISCSSTLDVGTSFVVTLPVAFSAARGIEE